MGVMLVLVSSCAHVSNQHGKTHHDTGRPPVSNGEYLLLMEGLIEHYQDSKLVLTTNLDGKPYQGVHISTHGRPSRDYKNSIPIRVWPSWSGKWLPSDGHGNPIDKNGNEQSE